MEAACLPFVLDDVFIFPLLVAKGTDFNTGHIFLVFFSGGEQANERLSSKTGLQAT